MITKLLTASAFTFVLATGAMAQTSTGDAGTSGGDAATSGSTSSTGANRDDDRCTETSAEQSSSTPSGTMPEEACPE